jgi:hypothetical protein
MTTTVVIPRADAVHAIAGRLADRDAFVLLIPPGMVPTAARCLANVTRWTGYLDVGLPTVLRTNSGQALEMLPLVVSHFGATTTAVITVPKTIPAATLRTALGMAAGRQQFPDDGTRDIVAIHETGPLQWPLLFIDALTQVDPAAAAQLHANDLTRQS